MFIPSESRMQMKSFRGNPPTKVHEHQEIVAINAGLEQRRHDALNMPRSTAPGPVSLKRNPHFIAEVRLILIDRPVASCYKMLFFLSRLFSRWVVGILRPASGRPLEGC